MIDETFLQGSILGQEYWGNTLGVYLEALAIVVGGMAVLWVFKTVVVNRIHKLAQRTPTDIDDFLIGLLIKIGPLVYFMIGLYLASQVLVLSPGISRILTIVFVIFLTVKAVQVLQETVMFFLTKAYGRAERDALTTAAVIKNMRIIVRIGLWVGGGVFILDNLGIQIPGVVAGLGIGGIAVALAAQAVLGDAFNSFAIFMDRPFEVGDFIIVGDLLGVVEHVGFKTTRIRSLHGEQLIFSNTDLTNSRIRNYKRMKERRIEFALGVVYQTPLEKMQKIPGMIQEIIQGIALARFDRAHHKDFGNFSLNIVVVYHVLTPDYNQYMDIQQEINFKIMEVFARVGIEFAYPTQTVFVAQTPLTQPL